jgi:hypothetical protein
MADELLPPPASMEQVAKVREACELDKAPLSGKSSNYATRVWQVHESQLRGAIIGHIATGKRIFRKHEPGGSRRLLPNHVQANVNLDEDRQIYIEMILMDNGIVILNAHPHEPGQPRLPQ